MRPLRTSSRMALLMGVVMLAAGAHWLVQGRPSGQLAREAAPLPLREGEVEAATLLAGGLEGVVMIDARRADDWRRDGVRGSLSITTQSDEDLATQLARHADVLANARKIALYCGAPPCPLSHELAAILKRDYAPLLGGEVLVVHGGLPALHAAGLER